MGVPLAFLLELHGWYVGTIALSVKEFLSPILTHEKTRWHIFTAVGGYIAVAVVDLVTAGEVHQDPTHLLAWPVPFAAGLMSKTLNSPKQS